MTNLIGLIFLLSSMFEVQTNWHLGSGNIGPYNHWGGCFYNYNNVVYSIPNRFSLSPLAVDTTNWRLYVVDNTTAIAGHNSIMAVDIDGDQDNDLIGTYSTYVVWYEQGDTLSFTKHIITNSFVSGNHGTVWPADIDSDKDNDIIVSGDSGLVWFENNNLSFTQHKIAGGNWYHARAGDIDNDGDIDVLAQNGKASAGIKWEGPVYIFKNDGNMNFSSSKLLNADTTWRTNLADFNNDRYLDIQTSGYNSKAVRVYLNDGTGNFNLVYRYKASARLDGSWPSDIDADGYMDIGVNYNSGNFFWLKNDGTGGNFTANPVTNGITAYGDGGMVIDLDMNNRGDIVGGYTAIGWFEQTSTGTFKEHRLCNASSCHWVYACNMGAGICGEPTDVSMDILYSDNGRFAFFKNLMISGYEDHGWLESSILDASRNSIWLRFGWHDCVPPGYTMTYRVRVGNSVADVKSAQWSAPIAFSGDSLDEVPPARYFQYRVELDDQSGTANGVAYVDTIWVEYINFDAGTEESPRTVRPSILCNTFSPEINYTITKEGNISLRMYDITGRLVKTLVEGRKIAGSYNVTCEAAPGVYFVRLAADGKTIVSKRVIVN